jgi:signal peptidase I
VPGEHLAAAHVDPAAGLRQDQEESPRHVHEQTPGPSPDEAARADRAEGFGAAAGVPDLPAESTDQRVVVQYPADVSETAPLSESSATGPAENLTLAHYAVSANHLEDGSIALRPTPRMRLVQVREELVAWLKTLASAAVYAVLIVTFGFQVARVEGQSMAPTLEDQDRLIVNKLVYRIGEPRRGDIVMLYYPLNPEKSFVKRVIAEEGDTVRIVDGRVYVNDIPLKDDYVPSEYRSHDDWGPQVIPEGYYFVMGDHRNNSSDSRHWGMVPKKYIIGKVQLRWWPVPTARVF